MALLWIFIYFDLYDLWFACGCNGLGCKLCALFDRFIEMLFNMEFLFILFCTFSSFIIPIIWWVIWIQWRRIWQTWIWIRARWYIWYCIWWVIAWCSITLICPALCWWFMCWQWRFICYISKYLWIRCLRVQMQWIYWR